MDRDLLAYLKDLTDLTDAISEYVNQCKIHRDYSPKMMKILEDRMWQVSSSLSYKMKKDFSDD